MTKEQIDVVKSSWGWVLANKKDAGEAFYKNLFEAAPGVKPLFQNDISGQAAKLVSTVTFAVTHLNEFDIIKEQVRALGKKHVDYGAKPEHYPVVAEQLIKTLKEGMGARFTPEVEAAWGVALNALATTMIEAAAEV